jgi:hypothetical protein
MAEIYLHSDQLFQFLVFLKEEIVVGGESFPFGKLFLDSHTRLMHVLDRHGMDFLKERVAALAVDEGEEVPGPVFA